MAGIITTITGHRERQWRWLTVGVAALAGCTLVGMSYPRVVAAFILLPGDRLVREMALAERPLDKEQLEIIIATRQSAAPRVASGAIRTEKGRAELLLASQDRLDFSRYWSLTQSAVASLSDGLMLTPADGYSWSGLVFARAEGVGYSARTASALKNSMYFAPNARGIAIWRLDSGLAQIALLDGEARVLLEQQVRFAWRLKPDLVRVVAKQRHGEAFVRNALLKDPELAQDAESAFPSAPQN